MKQILKSITILLIGASTFMACNSRQEVATESDMEKSDIQDANSIVRSRCIANSSDRKCREYFLVENGDTSTYSFMVRNYIYSNEFIITISDMDHGLARRYRTKDINGIQNALDSCLSSIAANYDIDSLKFIELPLRIMGDIALEFNKTLGKSRFPEEYYQHHPEALQSALNTTSLNERIDMVLGKHGIHICETTTLWALPTTKEAFLRKNIVSDSTIVPKELTLAYVRYKLEPIK